MIDNDCQQLCPRFHGRNFVNIMIVVGSQQVRSTALSELLSALSNSTILPHCWVTPIKTKTTDNNISRWTHSQQRLLRWMLPRYGTHLTVNPSYFTTDTVVYDFVQTFSFTTPNPCNRLLSATNQLLFVDHNKNKQSS
jgi:hypothetical protein